MSDYFFVREEVMSPSNLNEKIQQLANSLGVVVPADKEVRINCKSITAAAAGGW